MPDSGLSRRDFFLCTGALGAAAIMGEAGAAGPGIAPARPGEADFRKHLQQTFTIHAPDGRRHEATLIRVRPYRPAKGRGKVPERSYSLIFRLQGLERLPHYLYTVQHPELGTFELFMGAFGMPSSEVRLEAVFA